MSLTLVYPTTPDLTITVGDSVRVYVVPGEVTDYDDGYVSAIRKSTVTDRYVVSVTRSIRNSGQVETRPLHFRYPPVNGQPAPDGGVHTGVVRRWQL